MIHAYCPQQIRDSELVGLVIGEEQVCVRALESEAFQHRKDRYEELRRQSWLWDRIIDRQSRERRLIDVK